MCAYMYNNIRLDTHVQNSDKKRNDVLALHEIVEILHTVPSHLAPTQPLLGCTHTKAFWKIRLLQESVFIP